MEQELKRGDTPTTSVTNEMVGDGGFPAETEDGELVSIVSKENAVNGVNKLVAADGRIFREPKTGEAPGLKDYDQGQPDDEPVLQATDELALAAQAAAEAAAQQGQGVEAFGSQEQQEAATEPEAPAAA